MKVDLAEIVSRLEREAVGLTHISKRLAIIQGTALGSYSGLVASIADGELANAALLRSLARLIEDGVTTGRKPFTRRKSA